MDSIELEIDNIINKSLSETLVNNMQELENVQSQEKIQEKMNESTNNYPEKINSEINVTSNDPNVNTIDSIDDMANVEVFNTALHQYLRIEEEIKTLMIAIKTRNEIKRNLSATLSVFLKAKHIKKVDIDGCYKGKRLEVEVRTSKPSFTREKVTEVIMNELKEEQELFDKIMSAISRTSVLREMYKIKVVEEKKTKTTNNTNKKGKKQDSLADVEQLINSD
jgi:hypothetical protein